MPRAVDEPLQGRILQELLDSARTTSQLVKFAQADIERVRRELISLHHMGVIERIGIKNGAPPSKISIYARDYVWAITDHGMSHGSSVYGCLACHLRERALLLAGGLLP